MKYPITRGFGVREFVNLGRERKFKHHFRSFDSYKKWHLSLKSYCKSKNYSNNVETNFNRVILHYVKQTELLKLYC